MSLVRTIKHGELQYEIFYDAFFTAAPELARATVISTMQRSWQILKPSPSSSAGLMTSVIAVPAFETEIIDIKECGARVNVDSILYNSSLYKDYFADMAARQAGAFIGEGLRKQAKSMWMPGDEVILAIGNGTDLKFLKYDDLLTINFSFVMEAGIGVQ